MVEFLGNITLYDEIVAVIRAAVPHQLTFADGEAVVQPESGERSDYYYL